MKKNTIIAIVVIIIVAIVGFFIVKGFSKKSDTNNTPVVTTPTPTTGEEPGLGVPMNKEETVIGTSVEGRNITAYHFGTGETELLFVGGIHGGYEWNTALVAFETMDYLKANPTIIPSNVKVTVIPVLNPDGLNKVVGTSGRFTMADVPATTEATVPGRFNGNLVDLNRNFDCDWQATGKWQNRNVSGGSSAFSEPESVAIRNYVEINEPTAAIVWYSAANGVFASSCHDGVLTETKTLTNLFAKASGYKAYEQFNFYEITGDMVNWLAKINVPAISVLLATHDDTEWSKNKAGIDAVLKHYAQPAI